MEGAKPNYRYERIERLLDELRYEVTRGMMEGEIDEQLSMTFMVPISKVIRDGIVLCKFRTRPAQRYYAPQDATGPKLRIVKKEPG